MARNNEHLRETAREARQAAAFLAGFAEGVELAVSMRDEDSDASSLESEANDHPQRRPTQRPILDIMRTREVPMTVAELIGALQAQGVDPRPDTVREVMRKLVSRGVAERIGSHYRLGTRAAGSQERPRPESPSPGAPQKGTATAARRR